MQQRVNNFTFATPTRVLFGKDSIKGLPALMQPCGRRVLLVYGGGSIKKTGLYSTVKELLQGFEIFELSGVEPSPRIHSVREGWRLCRKQQIDMVLAVGGGSVIDCAKVICDVSSEVDDPWELVMDNSKITKALPLFTVVTLAASGSEFNCGAAITNPEADKKANIINPHNYPKASVLDPSYTMTVSPRQTAAGSADIISHVLEQYLVAGSAMVSEGLCEAILRTVIKFAPQAMADGSNYTARANLMWAGAMACSGICALGSDLSAWPAHGIEQGLAGFHEIIHGEGLAVLTPALLRATLNERTVERYAALAERVFHIKDADQFSQAARGIQALEDFFASLNLPRNLREAGVPDDGCFERAALHAVSFFPLDKAFEPLDKRRIVEILESSL